MSDQQLIAEVAKLWVAGGGDAEGIDYSWREIKKAVEKEINENSKERNICLNEKT